ncbi:MAG TPA: hypothetical protein VLF21_03305 [Candidatus Saccharimonadales bacterium]|nr:hypothetical protein [Candidatus Saccharimonadales bacterium]
MKFGRQGSEAALMRRKVLFLLVNSREPKRPRELVEMGWGKDSGHIIEQKVGLALRWLKDAGLVRQVPNETLTWPKWEVNEQARVIFAGEAETESLPIAIPDRDVYPEINDVNGEDGIRFVGVDQDQSRDDGDLGVLIEGYHPEVMLTPEGAEELADRLRQAAARARFEQQGRGAIGGEASS